MTRVVDLRKKTGKKEITPVTEKVPLVDPIRSLARAKSASPKDLGEATSNGIEWEAPPFYYNPQKKYLTVIVTALLISAGAIFFYHWDTLTGIALVLSSLMLVLYANKKPTICQITVNQAGITIEDKTYYYKELKSFWLDYPPTGPKELSLESKKWYMPYVKISIENQNPVEIRSLIIHFVAEREHEKSLVDLISRKIGL